MPHLALYTFGILRQPLDGESTQEFLAAAPGVFESASGSPGFVARRENSEGRYPRFYNPDEHALVAHTLTLWENLEAVYVFAYHGLHRAALHRRKEWFLTVQWPFFATWWVKDNDLPSWEDTFARFEYLHDHGPTPYAFNFKQPFNAAGLPVKIDRERVRVVVPRVQ